MLCICHPRAQNSSFLRSGYLDAEGKLESISDGCLTCAQVKAKKGIFHPGQWSQGTILGEFWELDFTEVKPGLYGYKYLLVFVITVTGRVDVLPS